MKGQHLIISTSCLATAYANDYLAQLCSHFAKRVPVEETANTVRVTLPIGTCNLTAAEDAILATVEMEPEHVDRMEEVFGGWIERFAFRETPNLMWRRATPKAGE